MPARGEIPLTKPELKLLYQRLIEDHGGEAGMEKILIDFYRRMAADVMLSHFFIGKDPVPIAKRQLEFFLRACGARESYTGKAPAEAHGELPPIWTGHFDRRLTLLEQTLRDHGLNEELIRIWMGFESAFREGIVS